MRYEIFQLNLGHRSTANWKKDRRIATCVPISSHFRTETLSSPSPRLCRPIRKARSTKIRLPDSERTGKEITKSPFHLSAGLSNKRDEDKGRLTLI